MNAQTVAADFRRILVALDASRESNAALEAAAILAKQLQAELIGLFIEDIDLLNLAALPFSREVSTLSRSGRVLDPAQVERELKSRAAVARRALAAAAETLHLQWSFRIARGRVDAELLSASQEADLVAVGKGTRPLSGEARLGRTGRAVAYQTVRSVLFAATAAGPPDAPVAVLYNGSAKSNAALTLAARLAESNRQRLIVFVLGDSAAAFAQHEIAVREQLRAMGMSGSIRRLRSADHASLLRSLQSEPIGLLVVAGKGQTAAADMALDLLVEKSNCSVLLVRG